jgi:hypothetical protein
MEAMKTAKRLQLMRRMLSREILVKKSSWAR